LWNGGREKVEEEVKVRVCGMEGEKRWKKK
jgi:hypothetical protein